MPENKGKLRTKARKLQFYHVKDLCELIKLIIETKPTEHILNVGNQEAVTIKEWVSKCYTAMGKIPEFVNVPKNIEQRNYFSFYDYEYVLDVSKQAELCPVTTSLDDGLSECANWYMKKREYINRKQYCEYIDLS